MSNKKVLNSTKKKTDLKGKNDDKLTSKEMVSPCTSSIFADQLYLSGSTSRFKKMEPWVSICGLSPRQINEHINKLSWSLTIKIKVGNFKLVYYTTADWFCFVMNVGTYK